METMFAKRAGALVLALLMAGVGAANPAAANPVDDTGEAGSIVGRLIDQGGDGVPFADVDADGDGTGHWAATTTDADGFYELPGLIPDDYRVMFFVEGRQTQFAFGKTDWDEADLIPVGAGELVVVNEQLLPTGVLTGRFTDADGQGVAAGVLAASFDIGSNFTFADDDGNWGLEVFPGEYYVEFQVGEFTQYAFGATVLWEATFFEVGAGETVVVNDQVLPHGFITGHLTDANGEGVESAPVTAQADDDDGDWAFGSTEDEGFFILPVIPGQYRVQFNVDGFTQYAFGVTSRSAAAIFEVGDGDTIVVNDTLLDPPQRGTVAGQFTDAEGVGMPGVEVSLMALDGDDWREEVTDADGFYEVTALPGDYHVFFWLPQIDVGQYAFGALTVDDAAVITVEAGETTIVDDSLLPTGSVRITAEDLTTGEPVTRFSTRVGSRSGETTTGEVILTDVPVGTHEIMFVSAPGFLFQESVPVTVAAGEQATVNLPLHPRPRIEVNIRDSVTGEPVAGVCVFAVVPERAAFPDGCWHSSDENGVAIVEVEGDGRYQLFAWPQEAEGYGAQWVGRRGGTGDQRRAVKVTVSDGVGTAPVVRMDQAGSISGTVTDPSGDPVPFGVVRLVPDGFLGSLVGAAWIQDGSYTLGQLGPYDWPLLFVAGDNPFQWSGGATDRYRGASVSVVAGETVGYHYQLREGTMVTIVLDDPGDAFVAVALNARTGDPVAFWPLESESGDLTRPVLGSQRVKFVLVGQGETFVGGDDFKSAKAFAIRRQGEQTINLN